MMSSTVEYFILLRLEDQSAYLLCWRGTVLVQGPKKTVVLLAGYIIG
jgi:hypothetical protein